MVEETSLTEKQLLAGVAIFVGIYVFLLLFRVVAMAVGWGPFLYGPFGVD